MRWDRHPFWYSRPLLDFEALTGFILVMLGLCALSLWLLYRFAFALLPAVACAVGFLLMLFFPYHFMSRATLASRTARSIAANLSTIVQLEQIKAPREQIWPLEARIHEAAQAQINAYWEQLYDLDRWYRRTLVKPRSGERRTLGRKIDELRSSYGVVPESGRWSRFVRLHLERTWVRWMGDHPRAACFVCSVTLISLTVVSSAALDRLGL